MQQTQKYLLGLGHDDTLFYPKVLLLEQLGSSLNVEGQHANKLCVRYFRRVENLVEKYIQKSQRSLSSAIIFGLETELGLTKNGLIMMCDILEMNENGTVMTFKQFEEKYDININITYTGPMCTSCKK